MTNAIVTYLAMRSSDAPGAEEATKMLKTVLPPPVQAVLDEDKNDEQEQMVNTPKGPVPAGQIGQILAQMEQQLQVTGEQLEKAQGDKQAAEAAKQQAAVLAQQNAQAQLALDAERLRIEQFNAETARIEAETALAEAQEQSVNNHAREIIDATAQETERYRIDKEGERSERETTEKAAEKPALTAEDIAAAIASTRQPITGMQIKAPNGGIYDLSVQTGAPQ